MERVEGMPGKLQQFIQENYGLHLDRSFSIKNYLAFQDKSFIYIMIPVFESEQEIIVERFEITQQLRVLGEKYVPQFVQNNKESYISKWDKQHYLLLRLEMWRAEPFSRLGRRLAKFHYRGASVSNNNGKLDFSGKWKDLWGKRIDQLEKVWHSVVMSRPANDFEKYFIESFPYYAGLTENAIAYFTDTLMDQEASPYDYKTVCHFRFSSDTWNKPIIWKNPFEWVIDHPSRDIAEFIREIYFSKPQLYFEDLTNFIQQYQSVQPISPFGWRLIYSRLVLPLHYITCVETYYSSTSEHVKRQMTDQLQYFIERSEDYEKFLAHFYDHVKIPVRQANIPIIEWLKK